MYHQQTLFNPAGHIGMTTEQAEEASHYSPTMVYTYFDVFSNEGCPADIAAADTPGEKRRLAHRNQRKPDTHS